MTKVQY